MMRFSKVSSNVTKLSTASLLCVTLFFSSCGSIDNSLGDGFVPSDQEMSSTTYSDFALKTFLLKGDTIITSHQNTFYWGSRNINGYTNADFAAQFIEHGLNKDSLFGVEPIADSLILNVSIRAYSGDTTKIQKMKIYELNSRLYYDSMYFSNFDILPLKGKLLCEIDITGDKYLRFKLYDKGTTPGDNAIGKFVHKLITADKTIYGSDSTFYKTFPGLYFELVNPNQDAALYTISPGYTSDKTVYPQTYLELHYRNKTMAADSNSMAVYWFNDDGGFPNNSVSMIKYDYSNTSFKGEIGDTTTLANGMEYNYVQGVGGLKSYIKFDQKSIQALKDKVKADGYNEIAINVAKLVFKIDNPNTYNIKDALGRLGLYSTFRSYFTDNKKGPEYVGIPDYNLNLDANGNQQISPTYNGYVNKTNGYYEMDITSFVTRMMSSTYTGDYGIILGPDVNYRYSSGQVKLIGSNNSKVSDRPKLILTYTMVGKNK